MTTRLDYFYLDGKVKLVTELTEFRMAIWINGFGIYDAISENEIIQFVSFFNLDKVQEVNGLLKIEFSIYPKGSETHEIEVNPITNKFKYRNILYDTNDFYKTITGEDWK